MASSKKKQSNGPVQSSPSNAASSSKSLDSLAMANELLKDIDSKTTQIKNAIKALEIEKAQLEADFKARMQEIDKQLGRLNSYLVRLGGGVVATKASNGSNGVAGSNGKMQRLTAQDVEKLEVQVIELAGRHGKNGLKRGDVMEALSVTATQASKVLSGLEQTKRLKAEGERAGRRYFLGSAN